MEYYSNKVGADFVFLEKSCYPDKDAKHTKFYINTLFNTYRRVLFLDSDILVNPHSPDIFEIVPEDMLGAHNVLPITPSLEDIFLYYASEYIKKYSIDPKLFSYNGKNYNSGVILCNRDTNPFIEPEDGIVKLPNTKFYDQNFVNMQINLSNIPVFDLGHTWNYIVAIRKNIDILNYNFIHYASCKSKRLIKVDSKKFSNTLNKD